MPQRCGTKYGIDEHEKPTAIYQAGMIELGFLLPYFQRYGGACARISFHIAQVVHIEHAHTKAANRRSGKQEQRRQLMHSHIVCATHRHQTKENEDEQIA